MFLSFRTDSILLVSFIFFFIRVFKANKCPVSFLLTKWCKIYIITKENSRKSTITKRPQDFKICEFQRLRLRRFCDFIYYIIVLNLNKRYFFLVKRLPLNSLSLLKNPIIFFPMLSNRRLFLMVGLFTRI